MGVPSQPYYGHGYGYGYGFNTGYYGRRQQTQEEIDDFVAFVDKWIPTDPKWRKKRLEEEAEAKKREEEFLRKFEKDKERRNKKKTEENK